MKSHEKQSLVEQIRIQGPTLAVHNVMTCKCLVCTNTRSQAKPPNQCPTSQKICKSKGGLTFHKKNHLKNSKNK